MKRAYNLMIGERTAEEIKIRIGSAFPLEQELTMEVKGRDLSAGLPKTLSIRSEEIREALKEPLSSILESIRITLERCPPELSADLVERGIVMAGGGALLARHRPPGGQGNGFAGAYRRRPVERGGRRHGAGLARTGFSQTSGFLAQLIPVRPKF